jgi:hypothetical protein
MFATRRNENADAQVTVRRAELVGADTANAAGVNRVLSHYVELERAFMPKEKHPKFPGYARLLALIGIPALVWIAIIALGAVLLRR